MSGSSIYGKFEDVYKVVNAHMFGGKLPMVLFRFTDKLSGVMRFCRDAVMDEKGRYVSEISVNWNILWQCAEKYLVMVLVQVMVDFEFSIENVVDANDGMFKKRMKELGIDMDAKYVADRILEKGLFEEVYERYVKESFHTGKLAVTSVFFDEGEMVVPYEEVEGIHDEKVVCRMEEYYGVEIMVRFVDRKMREMAVVRLRPLREMFRRWYEAYRRRLYRIVENGEFIQEKIEAEFGSIVKAYREAFGYEYKRALIEAVESVPYDFLRVMAENGEPLVFLSESFSGEGEWFDWVFYEIKYRTIRYVIGHVWEDEGDAV